MKDCINGLDEENCTKDSVHCDGFLCQNFECIPSRWRCDGIPDCEDTSDEHNCKKPKNQICDREHGFYRCISGECIEHFRVCDNHKDCPQGDDEGTECKSNGCHTKQCSQLCFVAPEGPQCYCRKGYVIDEDNITCVDEDECKHNRMTGLCSHLCTNTDGGYKCGCFEDYQLVNNKSCVVKESEPLLLFSNSEGIRGFWLKSHRFFPVYHSLRQTVGLDFLGSEERVFWIDLDKSNSGVYSVALTGEDFKPVVTNGLKSPEDIAIDWIAENIYVTDAELNRIIVCSLEGDMCSSTLFGELDLPRAVVVDPSHGLIFWTQWGDKKPGVFRAGMDGSNVSHIVTEDVKWPNGIAYDSVANRLYWTEAKSGRIEFLDLLTNERKIVLHDKVFHPFALDVFEEWVYWSDWITYSLDSGHKLTGHNQTTILKEMHESIMGVHVFHPLRQKSSYNPCWLHPCSHMCVLAPNRQFACVCPDHLVLSKDNQTCIAKPDNPFLIVGVDQEVQLLYSEAIGNDVMIDVNIPKGLLITDIAFDWSSKTLFVFDAKKRAINSLDLEDTKHDWKPLITSDLERVVGLTYDSHTNQLYWLEAKEGILEVSTTDGKSRALLLKDLEKPIDLALHPEHRRMYIALMGSKPRIIVSDMDGQNPKVLVSSKTGFAVSLAIDKLHEKLFWADAKNGIIEWMDLSTSRYQTKKEDLKKGVVKRNLGHVMSIAVHNKTLFWTDMDSDIVYHETFGGESPRHSRVIINTAHHNSGKTEKRLLMAFPEKTPHGPCSSAKGGCSHICLLGRFATTCLCPNGYEMKNDGQTCEKRNDMTDNSVTSVSVDKADHNSEEFGFISLDNTEEDDFNWFDSKEDEEADELFHRYDSKQTINESHELNNSSNDLTAHLMTTQTNPTITQSKQKPNSGPNKSDIKPKLIDLSDNNNRVNDKFLDDIEDKPKAKINGKIKTKKNSTKEVPIESKSDSIEAQPYNRKGWLTLFIAVLIVVIIVLLVIVIIKKDDYRYGNYF